MGSDEVRRDLGDILSHGEPEYGTGHGEIAEEATESHGDAFWAGELTPDQVKPAAGDAPEASEATPAESCPKRNGVVHVDFSSRGPDAA